MKKTIACLLLSAAILIGVVSFGAIPVAAESDFNASEECIVILKAEEGFSRVPYWDYSQYTVGYGTKCPDDMINYYFQNGITEEEAEVLLQSHLDEFEKDINERLIDKYQLTLTQNQFDAILLFSYNCGTGWLYGENDNLRNAIVSGATGNELIDRFTRWCNAGGQIRTYLLRRRLSEANMYLNGVYSQTPPENYGYVLYDAVGGVSDPNVQGFDAELTAEIIPTPTYEGYQFDGWYTEISGGTKVTVLDASVRNARLYAHWIDVDGNAPVDPEPEQGTSVTITTDVLNVRQGPGTGHKITGTVSKGEVYTVTEIAEGSGYTWGKFSGGWLCLKYTDYESAADDEPDTPQPPAVKTQMGTVKVSSYLCVRSGPSTGYSVVAQLNNGARVEILEQKIVGATAWGKIAQGWISMDYVELDPEETPPVTDPEPTDPEPTDPEPTDPEPTDPEPTDPEPTDPEPTDPEPTDPEPTDPEPAPTTLSGTVKVSSVLRVRTGPGTSYGIADFLNPNARITITETAEAEGTTWGKCEKGWISMDYVALDSESNTQPQSVTGVISVNDTLRIRSGPSTSYSIAGYLTKGTKVEILEQQTVNGTVWGRISKGWISMDYVVLDGQTTTPSEPSAPQKVTKTVNTDCLRIRGGAGTNYAVVDYLYAGAKVEILEQTTVGGVAWGRISKGWISLDYVK